MDESKLLEIVPLTATEKRADRVEALRQLEPHSGVVGLTRDEGLEIIRAYRRRRLSMRNVARALGYKNHGSAYQALGTWALRYCRCASEKEEDPNG